MFGVVKEVNNKDSLKAVLFEGVKEVNFVLTLSYFENEVALCEAQMENWKPNLTIAESKERHYSQEYGYYKVMKDVTNLRRGAEETRFNFLGKKNPTKSLDRGKKFA
ncbi:uncharacterized protein LOC132040297 [Lycium ferocissimum]|uniref:uncharacterized protein LOC132040297 n=1 Tax=Lycium ferocissimum TaxID=112874 RepID=UPI0028161881|nr:uncharacterized protein LOC132040297 [Lycium ferocissimum]